MNLTPIHDNIIFQFDDKVKDGFFVNQRDSGLIVDLGQNHEDSGKFCRTANVVSIGPHVEGFGVGDHIVIEHLMWTQGFMHEDQMYWMTRPEKIVGKMRG